MEDLGLLGSKWSFEVILVMVICFVFTFWCLKTVGVYLNLLIWGRHCWVISIIGFVIYWSLQLPEMSLWIILIFCFGSRIEIPIRMLLLCFYYSVTHSLVNWTYFQVDCLFCRSLIYAGEEAVCSVRGCRGVSHLKCVKDELGICNPKKFKCPQHVNSCDKAYYSLDTFHCFRNLIKFWIVVPTAMLMLLIYSNRKHTRVHTTMYYIYIHAHPNEQSCS